MPMKPCRPCKTVGCPELTHNGYCDKHKIINDEHNKQLKQKYESNRPNWHRLYSCKRWRDERLRYLMENPFCVECDKDGYLISANVVDHIIDHKGNYNLFWDSTYNWQSLCYSHHNSKTAKENKIFGNERM